MDYKLIIVGFSIILILSQFSVLTIGDNYPSIPVNINDINIVQVLTYNITVDKPGQYLVFIQISPDVLPLCKSIKSPYNIYVSSGNESLPYYVTILKYGNLQAINVLVLVNFTKTTKFINITIDTQKTYNFTKYINRIFNIFYYDFSSKKSLEELTKNWKIVNGDNTNSVIEFRDDYLYMFMDRTNDYVLAIVSKKSFKPPFNIYVAADLSCIDELESRYRRGLDSLFGLLNTSNIPEYFQPYLYTIADGYSFEVMDWNWPYMRYSVDRNILITPPATNQNGKLPISGKTVFLGIISNNKAEWHLADIDNVIDIYWKVSKYKEFYPVFLLKGNFAYASAIKVYFIGISNYTIITNNIDLVGIKLISGDIITITKTSIVTSTTTATETTTKTETVLKTSTQTITKTEIETQTTTITKKTTVTIQQTKIITTTRTINQISTTNTIIIGILIVLALAFLVYSKLRK